MNRKYPWKLFFLFVLISFTVRHFYFFLPGILLLLIGIHSKTCLAIGLALLIVDLVVSVIEQFQIRKASLEESDNEEFNELMDAAYASEDPDAFSKVMDEKIRSAREEAEKEREESQAILQKLVVYRTLNETIHDGMTLEEMMEAFKRMCEISVGDPDDLLFEAGTYSFTDEKLFYFSLVRQFQFMDEDEYVQLRLDVTYLPCSKTKLLFCSKWGSLTEGDFWGMVTGSRAYRVARTLPIHTVTVRVEET